MRRVRPVGVAMLGALLLGACGGPQPFATHPSGPRKACSSDVQVPPLATMADTSANRRLVVVDEPETLLHQAGAGPRAGRAGRAEAAVAAEILPGSPVGTQLLGDLTATGPRPLGYDARKLMFEVSVGTAGHQLSVVGLDQAGLPTTEAADSSLRRHIVRRVEQAGFRAAGTVGNGGFSVLVRWRRPSPPLLGLGATRIVELSDVRVAAGGSQVSRAALAAPLRSTCPAADPMTGDPGVGRLSSVLSAGSRSSLYEAMGTSLVASPVRRLLPRLSPAERRALTASLGLADLKATPTMAGFAYLSVRPARVRAVAATVYATPDLARSAATVLGPILRRGTSPRSFQPYRRLWQVTSLATRGRLVVLHLRLRQPDALARAVEEGDFPLFWAPAPPG